MKHAQKHMIFSERESVLNNLLHKVCYIRKSYFKHVKEHSSLYDILHIFLLEVLGYQRLHHFLLLTIFENAIEPIGNSVVQAGLLSRYLLKVTDTIFFCVKTHHLETSLLLGNNSFLYSKVFLF